MKIQHELRAAGGGAALDQEGSLDEVIEELGLTG
jgi:hypothetical protein